MKAKPRAQTERKKSEPQKGNLWLWHYSNSALAAGKGERSEKCGAVAEDRRQERGGLSSQPYGAMCSKANGKMCSCWRQECYERMRKEPCNRISCSIKDGVPQRRTRTYLRENEECGETTWKEAEDLP